MAWDVRVDTVQIAPAAMIAEMESLRLDATGLRARLEGRRVMQPERVVVTDTVIIPPDTVAVVVTVDAAGRWKIGQLVGDSLLRAPVVAEHRPRTNCDDGVSWAAGELVCDPARLGHLSLVGSIMLRSGLDYPARVMPAAELGLGWTPSYRSPWGFEVAVATTGEWHLRATRGLRLW